MTDEVLASLLERLIRQLGLDSDAAEDAHDLLEDELTEAEEELLLYLNAEELPARMYGYAVKLAAVFYRRDTAGGSGGLKAASYSEGDVSQNETYLTGEEYRKQADALLASLARYRQVTAG